MLPSLQDTNTTLTSYLPRWCSTTPGAGMGQERPRELRFQASLLDLANYYIRVTEISKYQYSDSLVHNNT